MTTWQETYELLAYNVEATFLDRKNGVDHIKQAMLARDKKKLEALRAKKAGMLLEKTGKDQSSGEIQ